MKKNLFALLFLMTGLMASAQTARGIKVGYIDMDYILQNVSDYAEAKNQLELKAQKWKQEAETKKNEIARLKDNLKTERPLLTRELTEEREEEITFLETELSDFQQKKFGPNGELASQKAVLVQPIQDQVFTAVQDIADARKYDFIFDKSSDLTMLFAAKRHDISDIVIRTLNRAANRTQKSKKQLQEDAAREYEEDLQDANPSLAERQKKLDERKAAREKIVEDRKTAAQAKRDSIMAARKKVIDDRNAKKASNASKTAGTTTADSVYVGSDPAARKAAGNEARQELMEKQQAKRDSIVAAREAAKKAATDARNKTAEERKKLLDERKAKVLADREAAKKAREDKAKEAKKEDETATPATGDDPKP